MFMDGMMPISDFGFRMADYRPGLSLESEIHDLHSGPVSGAEEKKKRLARDFESVLLTKMFDEVRQSVGQWSLDEDEEDGASQQVHGLFWLYLAQDVADKGGFGLWQEIYRHFGDIEGAGGAGERIDREL
jgi:Rod binding domain-containing protein